MMEKKQTSGKEQEDKDLSFEAGPISDFLKSTPIPDSTDAWAKSPFRLSAEQLDLFEKQGYLANLPVLTPEQVDLILSDLHQILKNPQTYLSHPLFHEFHANESPDPSQVLLHGLGHWRIFHSFHDLIFHPAITLPCAQLLNSDVRFWHDQLFCKPPKNGSCVAWHQDYSYWTRTSPMQHLTVHIALDDQNLENGCLHYVPGSHKWPLLPVTSRHFNDMESVKTVLNEDQLKQFKPTPMFLKKGEASIHHALTLHGSFPNRSEGPRRAAVVNVFADGTVSNSDDELLKGVGVIPKGVKMEGRFFPLLLKNPDF